MLELTKSAINYSLAMSLLGTQQLANLFAPGELQDSRRIKAALYPVTQAFKTELNNNNLIFGAFLLGDDAQQALIDFTFDSLELRVLTQPYIEKLTRDLSIQCRETFRVFSSAENVRLGWQELRNNFEVFKLVKNVSQLLDLPSDSQEFDLGRAIEKAYALGRFPDLWAIEGVGHNYALTFWSKNRSLRGILTEGQAAALPEKSLTMMHAGMGLAFASQLMNTVTPYSSPAQIKNVLREYKTLVKNNSRKGYEGAAYESLGLVTRFWHAAMVDVLDRYMLEVEPEMVGYFWHGVGRALYFFPTYFVPGLLSIWIPLEQEPPYELAKQSMVAGVAWATTLVDIRQPQIMETILRSYDEIISPGAAFTNGVVSALIMASDVTPGDDYVLQFLDYRPIDSQVAERWDRLIRRPGRDAVQRIYPLLKQHGLLGELFRYQDLSQLTARFSR